MFLCRVTLLTYKHKTHVINNDGNVISNADVEFFVGDVSILSFHSQAHERIICSLEFHINLFTTYLIEMISMQDMVHIVDTKTTKCFGDYFIRHISKACDFLFPKVSFRYFV
jgi:translation initiation factor 3 subunit L